MVASPGPVLGESGLQPSPRLAVHLAAVAVICGSSCSAVEDMEVLLATPVVAAQEEEATETAWKRGGKRSWSLANFNL